MKQKLVKTLPELDWIEDRDLREKTGHAWLEAMKRGGWSVEDLHRFPFTLRHPHAGIDILTHTRCVAQLSAEAAAVFERLPPERIPVRKDVLIAGALLHDVGKLLEYREAGGAFSQSVLGRHLRHPFSGAALCYELDLPEEVLHIIAMHSHEGDAGPHTLEAAIVRHADALALAVWEKTVPLPSEELPSGERKESRPQRSEGGLRAFWKSPGAQEK